MKRFTYCLDILIQNQSAFLLSIRGVDSLIKDRGLSTVEGMLAEGWTVSLDEIGCSQNPSQTQEAVLKINAEKEE